MCLKNVSMALRTSEGKNHLTALLFSHEINMTEKTFLAPNEMNSNETKA